MADYRRIEDLVNRYDRAVDALETDIVKRLGESIDASFRRLERELRRRYPVWQSQGQLYAVQRRLLLLDELKDLLELLHPDQREQYEQIFAEALQLTHRTGAAMADELVQLIDPGYPLHEFSGIPIEAAALQARDGVERLYRYNDDFKRAVSGVVEQGLIQGWGASKVARVLRGTDQMKGRFGVSQLKGKAETIARTEVMSALNDAAQQQYEESGIGHVQVINVPSEALCRICAARNMRVYKIGTIRVPFHPRCRDILAPYTLEWQKQGLTDDAFAKDYRRQGLDLIKQRGLTPDYGPTYWERKNQGLDKAPLHIWEPGAASKKADEKATPTKPTTAKKADTKPATAQKKADTKAKVEWRPPKPQKVLGQGAFGRVSTTANGTVVKESTKNAWEEGSPVPVTAPLPAKEAALQRRAFKMGLAPKAIGSNKTVIEMENLTSTHEQLVYYWDVLGKRPASRDLAGLTNAFERLHRGRIAHGDLHDENIFANKNNGLEDIRFIDYGYAQEIGDEGYLNQLLDDLRSYASHSDKIINAGVKVPAEVENSTIWKWLQNRSTEKTYNMALEEVEARVIEHEDAKQYIKMLIGEDIDE